MASTGLNGPYALTAEVIDRVVTRTSPGAYALGRVDADGVFRVGYVGRSDSNVGDRLHDHVGKYAKFKYGYHNTAKAAFDKECRLYHDFNPPGNDVHPSAPRGADWDCPVLGCRRV